jgi:hypothetical protein
MVYLMETNANVYSWLVEFYKKNPIPKVGSWARVFFLHLRGGADAHRQAAHKQPSEPDCRGPDR